MFFIMVKQLEISSKKKTKKIEIIVIDIEKVVLGLVFKNSKIVRAIL